MSWVREAIDGISAQPYEELYPTAYGDSAENPDIFWNVCPNEIPPSVKQAVETAVRQQTVKDSLPCAIIRLETLGGYYSQGKGSGKEEPVGHFAIYLGTSPANTDLKTHLSTNLGNPPSSPPKPPPTGAPPSKGQAPTHRGSSAAEGDHGAGGEREGGAHTPSMGEIEEEYSRVEERTKSSGKRLSKITANLENWMKLK